MNQNFNDRKPPRRGLTAILLTVILGASALGLTQCRLVDNTVSGIDLTDQSFNARDRCEKKCQDKYQDARCAEDRRHKAALCLCDRKRGKDRDACRKAEDKVHAAALKKIEEAKKTCKNGCYNEGGGHGGR